MKHTFLLLLLTVFAVFSAPAPAQQPPAQEEIPITVSATIDGSFSKGSPWRIAVKPDRSTALFVNAHGGRKEYRSSLSAAQLAQFRKLIQTEKFFELQPTYGSIVPDGSTRTLTITEGKQLKTVTLHYLQEEKDNLPEVKRALRVWKAVQNWVRDPDAVDLSPYDKRVLDKPTP
jgi:hypothetical protein